MSFPRYPGYKDSGVEWLGQVPEHWNRTALKFLADYQNGYPFKPDERGKTGLPIIRISQLTGDDEPAYYSGTLDERVKVRNGDLLFSWSATIDSYIWNKGEAWLNQHIFRVSPSKEADKRYLYYAIKHVAPKLADFDAHGSTMRHIKKESLGEKIYVPSVFDQGLIATFLDRETAKIDALIAEQQRLIELLQEKRQAVISHAVTKGLNPDAPMKDSGVEWLGEVPEHWQIKRLKQITSQISVGIVVEPSKYYDDLGKVPALRSLNVKPGYIDLADCVYITNESNRLLKKSVLRSGDLVIVRSGQPGTCAVIPEEMDECNCIDLIFLRRPEHGSSQYLMHQLSSESARYQYGAGAEGAIQQHFNVKTASELVVAWPPLREQGEICQYLSRRIGEIDALSQLAEHSVSLLQARRSALISAAVTGQIDVRGLASQGDPV